MLAYPQRTITRENTRMKYQQHNLPWRAVVITGERTRRSMEWTISRTAAVWTIFRVGFTMLQKSAGMLMLRECGKFLRRGVVLVLDDPQIKPAEHTERVIEKQVN